MRDFAYSRPSSLADAASAFAGGGEATTRVIDATTYEQKLEIERAGGDIISVPSAR